MQPEASLQVVGQRSGITRPGGRTARKRRDVRDATLAELAERGYAGLTVEGVAARSGVHKTTLYRRWGGVDGLLVDALALAAEDDWQPPDTGDLERDLHGLAAEVLDTFSDPEQAAVPAAVIAASFQSDRAAQALHAFLTDRFTRAEVIVTRAVDRGDLPEGTDAAAVVRAVTAPLYFRLFITGEGADATVAAQSVAATLAAARAGVWAAAS